MFATTKHKNQLLDLVSDCFEPIRSDLGNVHPDLRDSTYISGALLGFCRAYVNHYQLNDGQFNLFVDAVFEEVFRHQSITMQTRAEQWLNEKNTAFMEAYYHARQQHTELKLDWLSQYVQTHFKKAVTLGQQL